MTDKIRDITTALLITGDTYTSRREIKAIGGKWNPDEGGWLTPLSEKARDLAERKGFGISEIEVDPVLLETPTGERLRAIRQAEIDKRNAQKLAKAERLEKMSSELRGTVNNDVAFWTEPIKIGHHSEKRQRRERQRQLNKIERSIKMHIEADELRDSLLDDAKIAGDAERKRQSKRDGNDNVISAGSRVFDWSGGHGTVLKVNKKTYRIQFDRGFTWTRDKSFVEAA